MRLAQLLTLSLCVLLLSPTVLSAQDDDRTGGRIGKVSTLGDLIVMELDEGALGKANLFDLAGHTVRFLPQHSRYSVETESLHWDPEFGPELSASDVKLQNFSFPFSDKTWNALRVGTTGWISFGESETQGEEGNRNRGVSI